MKEQQLSEMELTIQISNLQFIYGFDLSVKRRLGEGEIH